MMVMDVVLQKLLDMAKDSCTGPVQREQIKMAETQLQYTYQQLSDSRDRLVIVNDANMEFQKENKKLRKELEKYSKGTYLVDIGPCCIKKSKKNVPIIGFYCNLCDSILVYTELNNEQYYRCVKCGIKIPNMIIQEATK